MRVLWAAFVRIRWRARLGLESAGLGYVDQLITEHTNFITMLLQ